MPVYEYECECGHRFEEYRKIEDRNSVVCPMCKKLARLKISLSSFRMAVPFSVFAHNGTLLHTRQTPEKTPPLGYGYENENLAEV